MKIPVFPSLLSSSASAAVEPRHWCLIIFLHSYDVELASLFCKLDIMKHLEKVLCDFGEEYVGFQPNFKENVSTISQNSIMPLICLSKSHLLGSVDFFFHLFGGFNDFLFMLAEKNEISS